MWQRDTHAETTKSALETGDSLWTVSRSKEHNVKVNVIKRWDSCVGGHLMITDVHIHLNIGDGPISWYKQNVNNLYFTY